MRHSHRPGLAVLLATCILPAQSPPPLYLSALPGDGRVFAFNLHPTGRTYAQLQPAESRRNGQVAKNFARSAVYLGPRQTVELRGVHAPVTLSAADLTFYLRIPPTDAEGFRGRVHLVRLAQARDRRVVSTLTQNAFHAHHGQQEDQIASTVAAIVPGQWLQLTPQVALPAGEYAIVLLQPDATLAPDYVYDFSVPPPA